MFVTCIKSTNENGTSCSPGRYGLWNTFRSSSGSQGIPSGLLHSNPPCTYINILVRISAGSRSPTFGSLNPDPQKYPRSPMKVTKYNPKCIKNNVFSLKFTNYRRKVGIFCPEFGDFSRLLHFNNCFGIIFYIM